MSFKNTRETAQAINGWKLQRAQTFLENVLEKKEAVPMRRYCGSIGRTAQGTTREKTCSVGIWNWEHEAMEGPATNGKHAEGQDDIEDWG